MPSISTTPPDPIPGRTCKVRASATDGGTAIRIWCTDAPIGSALRKRLDETGAARVAFSPPVVDAGKDFDFTPDAGGGFVLTLDELQRGSGFTGDYEGDPRGAPTETILTSDEATLRVADAIQFDIGAGQDIATVLVHTLSDRLITTRKDVHGVASPAIVNTKSARAKAAAATSEVRAAVAELAANQPGNAPDPRPLVSFVVGALSTSMGNVVRRAAQEFEDHITRQDSHEAVDNDNVLEEQYDLGPVDSVTGQAEALSKLLTALERHIRNANPDAESNPSATNSADPAYHSAVGWASLPMANIKPAGNPASVRVAAAEFWRSFTAHMADTTAHPEADGVNSMGTPTRLMDLHIKFLTELAAMSPSIAPSVNSGTVTFLAEGARKV